MSQALSPMTLVLSPAVVIALREATEKLKYPRPLILRAS